MVDRRIISLFSLVFITSTALYGQSSPISTGGLASGSGGSVSYTIGQTAYSVASGSSGSLSQGVQHPFEILVITSVTEDKIELSAYVHPNPTTQGIMLETQNPIAESLDFVLYDLNGRVLIEQPVLENQIYIPLDIYTNGPYILKVKGRNNQLKIFKVIKKQ